MDVGVYSYPHGDSLLIDKIVNEFLSQGKFDKLRKECMSDADTKPAYQNLQQRVENTVTQFLRKQVWRPDLNKNQLRDSLRKHILESKFFDAGINRIVDQVVNPNLLATVFLPEVEEVVYNYLSIPRPSDRNQKKAPQDDKFISSGRESDFRTSQSSEKSEKYGSDRSEYFGDHKRENHNGEEDYKSKDSSNRKPYKEYELSNEPFKTEPDDRTTTTTTTTTAAEEKIKSDPEEQTMDSHSQIEKMEIPSDESQESLNRMAAEGLSIHETESAPVPDSDDSFPLEINEKSMSESRDSEDSIMNQMSPISQGRLTPELEGEDCSVSKNEELEEKKEPDDKKEGNDKKKEEKEKRGEEKKPLTFIGRIPKIKRDDSKSKDERREKVLYSSDESDSSKRDGSKKHKNSDRSRERQHDRSKDRHKDRSRDSDRERHKKSSSSSSSSQRERSSSHHKSSHRHRDSKSRRKEEEKKKTKSTDDHGKEKIKKDDRRSTDRDSNERERDRSSAARSQGESRKREKEQQKTEESKGESSQKEEEKDATEEMPTMSQTEDRRDSLNYRELFESGILRKFEFPKIMDDFYVKFNSTGFRYFEEWEKTKLDCEEEFKEFVDEAEVNLSLLSDDDSDFEFEFEFSEENKKTIADMVKGVGNFPQSVMFDPMTSLFYSWKDREVFERIRKEGVRRRERRRSEESMKENIDRALHLKLLKKYRRRAMGVGRRRGRGRGIKEQNCLRLAALPSRNLVGRESSSVPEGVGMNLFVGPVEAVTLPDSPEETEDWSGDRGRTGGRGEENNKGKTDLQKTLPLNLPPSPDSDDLNNGLTPKDLTLFRKRTNKGPDEMGTPKKQKQSRRNYSQKYDSQDLYKPRPILNTSRTRGRGRERELESNALRIGSPISR